jgi:catechol 2,3-dioxygenase-like lactoylglutathione lyase family enzyme
MHLSHIGIVVSNIEAARDRLAALLGVIWGPISESRVPSGAGGDAEHVGLRVCFSRGEPAIELIEEVPGTVWTSNQQSNLHHISYFVDDVAATSKQLAAVGCPLEYMIPMGDGSLTLAYHRDALGARIELVSTAVRSKIDQANTKPS